MQCGKVTYKTKGDAIKFSESFYDKRARHGKKVPTVTIYECKACHGWHISNHSALNGTRNKKKRKDFTDSQELTTVKPKPQKNQILRIKRST